MQEVFAIVWLNIFGFVFGVALGKSLIKDEGELSNPAVTIVLIVAAGSLALVIWLGLSMGWI